MVPPAVPSASPAPALDLDRVLADRFRLRAFHAWQREAIDALLEGPGHVVVIAPTGGGKSLCYQLPAAVLPGTTVVISPLIALMEDQVRSLDQRGIPATLLATTLDQDERRRRLTAMRAGKFKLVYAAPERLASDWFTDLLGDIDLSLLAIDEAHCIVQWGHDFRPDYLRIGALIDKLRPRRVMACTATATPESQREILVRLRFDAARTKVILRGFARPNLELAVREVDGLRDALRFTDATLKTALGAPARPSMSARGVTSAPVEGAAIVYTATRRAAESIAKDLGELGWGARAYHAGMASDDRSTVQRAFADKKLAIVVATNAFGMGIDRSDVRAVVHVQPAASLEGYYQEVGRAGRDGAPATGLLMIAPGDIGLRRRLCEGSGDGGTSSEQVERAWSLFRELLRYVDAATCRHDYILRYFGDEAESLGGCGHCDVCRHVASASRDDPEQRAREALVVRQALAAVARAKGRGGMQAIAEMLRGQKSERVERFGFDQLSTYGLLSAQTHDEIMRLMRALLAAGWIDLTSGEFPTPVLTPSGAKIMRAEEPVRMRLPRAPAASSLADAPRKRRRAPAALSDGPVAHSGPLFEALRVHRAQLASEAGIAPFMVAHDRTLAAIAARRPTTTDELADVPGLGPAKIARYGEGFLGIVRRCP
jgi:ATP-dependent DNA helicase RecQ